MTLDFNPNPALDEAIADFRWPQPEPARAPRPEPEGRWEGPMRGERGSARALRTTLVLQLSLRGGRVRGEGHSSAFPHDSEARTVAADGEILDGRILLDLRFPASPYFRDKVFAFSGRLSEDGKTIAGAWTFRCEHCTCEGSGGALELIRVEDE